MLDTVKYYLRLCWFDADPLYLVQSTGFLKLNILVYAIVQYFLQTNMTDDPFESFTEVILESLFIFIFVAVMLFFDKRLNVYVQVTSSVLFCTNILSIFFIPIMVWLTVTEDPLSYYVMGILVLWFYALITYIIKTSLTINSIASIALSLLYFITVYLGAIGLGQLL
jgi:hypothetical protein